MIDQKALAAELDTLIRQCLDLRKRAGHDDFSGGTVSEHERVAMLTSLAAAIRRLSPTGSQYPESVAALLKGYGFDNCAAIPPLLGIATSLRDDIAAGRTKSAVELIHGELFSDFLEMADHLLGEGFKDPAAVLAGAALEAHLRQLAVKHNVSVTDGKGQPKKADLLNSELVLAGAYGKLDQKSVTAWLDLRNKAAHGRFTEYAKEQVALMVAGIRDFITRLPA